MVLSIALVVLTSQQAPEPKRVSSLTGDIRHHRAFESKILGNRRNLIVYLPPNYEREPSRRYPVLYMHDGQNLFDGVTSFLPNLEWRVDETAERLIREGKIEPLIVVGIENAGMERANEYLPTRAKTEWSRDPIGGKADLYGRMILQEIKPMIDRTYRTRRGRLDTGLAGSSFGGVVTMHLGLRNPGSFGKLAVISPSVWWDDRVLLKEVAKIRSKPHTKIWLDMGTREGYTALRDVRLLKQALIDRGWRLGSDLAYMEDPMAVHNEGAWAKRMEPILRFLFPLK